MIQYPGMNASQNAEMDRLMSISGKNWPDSLKAKVENRRPHNGDELCEIAKEWVRANVS